MKRFLIAFLVFPTLLLANAEPPLPLWDTKEHLKLIEDGWIAGGVLLVFDPLPTEEKQQESPLAIEKPTAEEIADEESNQNEVREEFIVDYFAEKPVGHLVDPQKFLGTKEANDMEAFLTYHSGDSSIDIFVYVFGSDQQIPGDVREEEVVERLYSVGKPAMVIYYFLGSPQRSEMYLSPVLTDGVSDAEQRRALQSSVMQAFSSVEPFEQLKEFLVQMSIRTYWMERMTSGSGQTQTEGLAVGESARKFQPKTKDSRVKLPDWAGLAGAVAVACVGALILIYVLCVWLRARARYVFPEFDVEPRLGGNHAAGIGAVITFSSAAVPPARQRDQVPDYMRRG